MRMLLTGAVTVWIACSACNTPGPRLNAPPHGATETASDLQGLYVSMADNALLADMTVTDVHFQPNRPMLNSLGEERLTRLAALMEAYGGEIRFDTELTDKHLIEQRIATIREYLCDAGLNTSAESVRLDMAGGRGANATEVILIKAEVGSHVAKKSSGSATPVGTTGVTGASPDK